MSKTKQITKKEKTKRNSAEDIFVAYKKNTDKFFTEFERAISQYHITMEDFQKGYVNYLKKMCDSALSLQQEFANSNSILQSWISSVRISK